MTRYFLDTTAHVERWAGDTARQEYVRKALEGETHASSTHALREWRHIVEGSCVEILNVVEDRSVELSGVFARLSQGWGRSAGQRLRVLSMITNGESALDRELMAMRAERFIRYQADEMFHADLDTVRDGSECGLARNVSRRNASGQWEFVNERTGSQWCKKTDVICRQDADLKSKSAGLEAAADALLTSTAHKAMAKAAQAAAVDGRDGKGKACFQKLGDVSLALECAEGEVVLTTDHSYVVMATRLKLDVERFDPTPTPA